MPIYLPTWGLPPVRPLTSDQFLSHTLPPADTQVSTQALKRCTSVLLMKHDMIISCRTIPQVQTPALMRWHCCCIASLCACQLTDLCGLCSYEHDQINSNGRQVTCPRILGIDIPFDLSLFGKLLRLLGFKGALNASQHNLFRRRVGAGIVWVSWCKSLPCSLPHQSSCL